MQEIRENMSEQTQNPDWEVAHTKADDLLIETIKLLSPGIIEDPVAFHVTNDILVMFNEVGKVYS